MTLFWELIEATLTESAALTKGSQRVMNDPKLVSGIADTLRDDVRTNPSTFPPDSKTTFKKASDQELAHWFLENLDKIEKQGYEGTVYSRDGVNSEWIARKYIAGAHSWEDILGVANMNLRDWYSMKNRFLTDDDDEYLLDKDGKKIPMLDPKHQDLWKFNGVRDLGRYITTHYNELLKKVRDASKLAAVKKQAKAIKLVDNDDYKIYTVFNWAGARTLGNGTQWCTANSEYDTNYNSYSSRAMLFQLYPKNPESVEKAAHHLTGKTSVVKGAEKYQFDAGTPTLNDIADHPADKEFIKKKYPYLYSDLVKGLKDHKAEIEADQETWKDEPSMQTKEAKTKTYDVDAEIKKLKKLEDLGYFTKKVRPSEKPEAEPGSSPEQTPVPQSGQEQQPGQGEVQMEEVDKDVAAMLSNLKKYDILKESMAPVLEKKKDKSEWHNQDKPEDHFKGSVEKFTDKFKKKDEKKDKVEEETETSKTHKGGTVTKTEKGLTHKSGGAYGGDKDHDKKDDKDELDEAADAEVLEWMKRFANLGNMGPDKR
jgi:hypothetical protein